MSTEPIIHAFHQELEECFGDPAKTLKKLKHRSAPDVVVVMPGHDEISGAEAFVALQSKTLDSMKATKRVFKLKELEEHGDLTMARFLVTVILPDGSKAHLKTMELWKRIDGEWKRWRRFVAVSNESDN
ncbi:hypothetical protein M427DRAFT_139264 [Gonapodya prolifera JEL478]|uniref:SnoaL-like domain-containing protein n=1 Tax=Gonapodya prolifera (strain JEL478) TaxID=1344416 RepID=A0A139A1U7_GONPJ|nr:hypothetical protein M427DRAFT_139264 [Gonapodya prolifera JEL478]|eukprot:KXS10515.1 hypothetical protein M427DRAFT_139264 [Gonapodya prolifera JEL478]